MVRAAQTNQDLRQKILEEAIGIVYRDGTEKITMRALGEKLGYSPATIYLYFRNKDDLLLEIARYGFRLFAERNLAALESEDVRDGLRRHALGHISFAFENRALYLLMMRVLPPARFDPAPQSDAADMWAASHRLFERGCRSGLLMDVAPEALEAVFVSAIHGFVDFSLFGRLPIPGSEHSSSSLGEAFADALLASITRR